MAEYNMHDNKACNDATAPEFAPFTPVMDQSGSWNTTDYPPLDSAPFVGAGSGGNSIGEHYCAAEECHTSFNTARELEQHAVKEKYQAFRCACGKGFNKRFVLTRHIDEAKGLRQYECPCCAEYSAKREDHLRQHLRTIHRVSKKPAIEALLKAPQAAPGNMSRRSKAVRTVAPVNTVGSPVAAAAAAAFSSGPAPLPVPALARLSPFPSGGVHPTNAPGSFSFPDAGFAANAAGFPASPMGFLVEGMTGFGAGLAGEDDNVLKGFDDFQF